MKDTFDSSGEKFAITHHLKDATEKLFLHTIYSSTKHISILYLVPFCVK